MKLTRRILVAVTLCSLVLPLDAQNLITNGDFENGMGNWYPWFVDENAGWAEPPVADAEFFVKGPGLGGSDNALYIEVYEPGKYDWYILVSKSVPMEQGNMYEISLRAASDLKKSITIGVHQDISSGSPFFSETIDITKEDELYGPIPFIYELPPIQPGIKINVGGMEGNVSIDDVVITPADHESDYTPYNTLEAVIGDVTLPHEGLPHGVPSSYDWSKGPRRGTPQPPDDWTAAIAWGQLYEWIEGNPATNTRVQIRDMAMYYLSTSDGAWHLLQKSLRVDGAAYREDFVDNINKPADMRTEPDGSISVTAGDGFNFHYWPSLGRVEIPQGDVEGCFVTVQCRLILDDPDGLDDRDAARYLMGVGGDWWESMTAQWDNWTTNWDMGIGRFRFITTDWMGYNLITLPVDQVRENPPPIAGSTAVSGSPEKTVTAFELRQNYPNPFNPRTMILYSVSQISRVKLQIFDVTGREIAMLVEGTVPPGLNAVEFDGSEVSSGLYFYKLTVGDRQLVRKMILAK